MKKRMTTHRRQKGFTLLEYCAGAAIIATILWVALNTMGNNVSGLLNSVGQWANRRSAAIDAQ